MCNIKSLHKQPDQSNLPELMIAYLRNNNLDQVPVMQPTPYSRWSLFQISMLHPPTSHKADMFSSMKKLTRLDISQTRYEFVVVPAHMSPRPVHDQFLHWQIQSEESARKHWELGTIEMYVLRVRIKFWSILTYKEISYVVDILMLFYYFLEFKFQSLLNQI